VQFQSERVISVEKQDGHFVAQFDSGKKIFRKVILAYGVQDQLPDIPGFKELWGKAVFHCPYCHGYEVRGSHLGLIANGKFLEHMLPMIYGLSKDLVVFTQGKADLSEEVLCAVRKNRIRVVEDQIAALNFTETKLNDLVLENGERIAHDGLFLAPKMPFQLKSQIGANLGCEKTDFGFYKVDGFGKTTVPGVFAAGDITSPMHSVLASAASGQLAGAAAASEILALNF
jgi:thioredoxin reductase